MSKLGILFIIVGLLLLARIFSPIAIEEIKYSYKTHLQPSTFNLQPINTDFSIVIPKIRATAPIVADVDPYDSKIYQSQLAKGVAHAAGSAYPGTPGNTFLFAHSAGNLGEASRYNAVFYLISKLESTDEIIVWYQGQKYSYQVTDKKLVSASDVSYLKSPSLSLSQLSTLTLMTCWPPGTTLKRLLILATLNPPQN